MSFRSALRDFDKVGLNPIRFHEKTAVERAKVLIEEKIGNTTGTFTPPEDLDTVAARVIDRLENRQRLDMRDLNRAPWCIWHGRMQEREPLVIALLKEIAERGQRRAFRMLAAAWLYHFKPEGFCISRIGGFLARNAGGLGYPYAEAHANYLLFDAESGPTRIADVALKIEETPDQILFSTGIRGNAVGYREDVYRKGFARLHGIIDPEKRLGTLEKWVCGDDKKVRFDTLRPEAVSAALVPFGDAMPEKQIRDLFLAFALDLLGDPRVNASKWHRCEEASKIVRRWLTEQSLRQFFEVVGHIAMLEHWDYRHAFWNALYRKDYIRDAWVVFDAHGEAEARRMFQGEISFARFTGAVQRNHAVLLLRIGHLVVAEWSHSGSCRIWDESQEEHGPKLYKKIYDASEVRLIGGTTFGHHQSHNYGWQRKIADYLRTHCNIHLTINDYRVR